MSYCPKCHSTKLRPSPTRSWWERWRKDITGKRRRFLEEHGFRVKVQPLEAPLDTFNMSTLMLEKEDLEYKWSFKTHPISGEPPLHVPRHVSPWT